ncbi:MAG: hypothetical protein U1F50_09670 [Rubrivivax sp.]
MPWFVAKRAVPQAESANARFQFRVFSEDEIEAIGPEWDWASACLPTREEAEREADELFWDSLE